VKNFFLGILVTVILVSAAYFSYQYGKNSVRPVVSEKPAPVSTTIPTSPSGQLVGNDKDEHGCISSAGYSWCGAKNKCLRVWEEGCPLPEDAALIKAALFKKNNWPDDNSLTFVLTENDGKYAHGTVNGQGGGGYWYAAKVNGVWAIVADGNGMITCASLKNYPDYPKNLIPSCYDGSSGNTIPR
jgi:hypothetical protein